MHWVIFVRINKFLAACGLGSRRKCEQYVLDGKVVVDGNIIKNLSFNVDTTKSSVVVDGVLLNLKQYVYLMLFKPKGYITSKNDDKGRKTIMDLLPSNLHYLNPIGRLDYNSEGLLLFTNNGALANYLALPSSEIEKTYVVKIEGKILESELAVLRAGVVIDGKRTKKAKLKLVKFENNKTTINVVISEGKNRQIRKMFESIGKNVIFLKRIKYGPISLGGLSRGKYRLLNDKEINSLLTYIWGEC